MKYSRAIVALGLMAAVTVALLVVRRPAAPSPTPVRVAATVPTPRLKQMLGDVLKGFLVRAPRGGPVVPLMLPGGSTCFVGGGGCSETPCVVPVQSSTPTAVPAISSVSLVSASPVPLLVGKAAIVGRGVVAGRVRPLLVPAGRCPSPSSIAPRTLRVVAPTLSAVPR